MYIGTLYVGREDTRLGHLKAAVEFARQNKLNGGNYDIHHIEECLAMLPGWAETAPIEPHPDNVCSPLRSDMQPLEYLLVLGLMVQDAAVLYTHKGNHKLSISLWRMWAGTQRLEIKMQYEKQYGVWR